MKPHYHFHLVRFLSLELTNFKNIAHGFVCMEGDVACTDEDNCQSNIMGLYGQNGSGKTSVIEALQIIKHLITGKKLPPAIRHLVSVGENAMEIKTVFTVARDSLSCKVGYDVKIEILQGDEGPRVGICYERLRFKSGEPESRWRDIAEFDKHATEKDVFLPKKHYKAICDKTKTDREQMVVARALAFNDACSYIFGGHTFPFFCALDEYSELLVKLKEFMTMRFHVIERSHIDGHAPGVQTILFYYATEEKQSSGDINLSTNAINNVPLQALGFIQKTADCMNKVLPQIIPGFALVLKYGGDTTDQNGVPCRQVVLVARRKDVEIALQYESEGIRKIISILSLLIAAFNRPDFCLAVDELDSGIYEHLLGEILQVFESDGSGQLIYTAHNLHPMEMLNSKNIIVTTTNPNERFVRMQYLKKNNNLRDVYLRTIRVGGQTYDLYEETDSVEIARSFREAVLH